VSRWWPDAVVLTLGEGADALADVERRLDAAGLPARARVRVAVDSGLLRWAIVPWHPSLLRPSAREALARHVFRSVHGDVAQGWAVCCAAPRYGAGLLAGAMDAGLLSGLRERLAARQLRLAGVAPAFTVAFDRVCPSMVAPLFWFVLHEPRWTTLLLMERREPRLIKRMPTVPDLGRCLDREWLALGMDGARCPVHVHAAADAVPLDAGEWAMETV